MNMTKLLNLLKQYRKENSGMFNLVERDNGIWLEVDLKETDLLYRGTKREEFLRKGFNVIRDFIIENNPLTLPFSTEEFNLFQNKLDANNKQGKITFHHFYFNFDEYKVSKYVNFKKIQQTLLDLRYELGHPVKIDVCCHLQQTAKKYFSEIETKEFKYMNINLTKEFSDLKVNDILNSSFIIAEKSSYPNPNCFSFDIIQDHDAILLSQLKDLEYNDYYQIKPKDSNVNYSSVSRFVNSEHVETLLMPYYSVLNNVINDSIESKFKRFYTIQEYNKTFGLSDEEIQSFSKSSNEMLVNKLSTETTNRLKHLKAEKEKLEYKIKFFEMYNDIALQYQPKLEIYLDFNTHFENYDYKNLKLKKGSHELMFSNHVFSDFINAVYSNSTKL